MSLVANVSKQGIDVLGTAGTVPNNLIFSSSLNTFKILAQGTATGTLTPTAFTEIGFSIAHNQGAIPFVFSFFKFRGDGVSVPVGGHAKTMGNPLDSNYWLRSTTLTVDGTNINFGFIYGGSNSGNATVDASYYIVEVPAT